MYEHKFNFLVLNVFNVYKTIIKKVFSIFRRPTSALNQKPTTNGDIPQREDTEYPSSGFGSLPNTRSLFPSGMHTQIHFGYMTAN